MVSSHHNYHLHHFRVKHRLTLIHFFFFQAEDGIRDRDMTGVQTCALPISLQQSGQAHSKYRHFTLGMSLTRLLERTGQKMADVKLIHGRPTLVQEVNWWPPSLPGASFRSEERRVGKECRCWWWRCH